MAIEKRIIGGVIIEDDFDDNREPLWKNPERIPQEVQNYAEFMYNPENSGNCSKCPANQDFSEWPGYRKPCGQFSCWVDVHCR